MNNQFFGFLQFFDSHSKKEISINFVFSIIISFVFALIMFKVIKRKKELDDYNRILLGCSFFVSVIFYSFSSYIYVPISSILVQLIFKIVISMFIVFALCLIEWLMFNKNIDVNDCIKKLLLIQGIYLLIFSVICKLVKYVAIVIISSFM